MRKIMSIKNIKDFFTSKESEVLSAKNHFFKILFLWTFLVALSLSWNIWNIQKDKKNTADNIVRTNLQKDTATRFWAAGHGGLYVPISEKTPPNPNLSHMPQRDIVTPEGTKLTLMNPAYMIRQLMEEYKGLYGVKGKITSLKYLYKGNKPDEWEIKALKSFDKGASEAYEYINKDSKEYLRFMKPLIIEESCLKCHASQGYKAGDIRGGLGVILPMEELNDMAYENISSTVVIHIVFWLSVLLWILCTSVQNVLHLKDKIKTKQVLEESEKKFHLLYDNAPDMYLSLSPEDEKISICNDTLVNKTGYTREELVGSSIFMLFDEECIDETNKDFKIFIQKGNAKDELVLKAKNGTKIYVSLRINSIKDKDGNVECTMYSFRDISEQKELEDALKLNQNYLENLFKSIPNIMITTNGQEIDRANNAMLEFVGYNSVEAFKNEHNCICDLFLDGKGLLKAEVQGVSWLDYTLQDSQKLHKVKMLKEDVVYTFIVWAKPLFIDEKMRSVVTFTDITELEKAYKELNDKDEIMLAQSRHAAMGEMISMIAHQWRQPISAIAMGANNILADIELDMLNEDTLREGARTIVRQTQELSKTIDDFRGFFKPNKNIMEVSIDDVFSDVYAVIGKSLENNNIQTNTHYDGDKKIKTYSRELMQVFINIVKNAKEALVENKVEDAKIDIFVDDLKDGITVKICDNGGGIREDVMEHIFDPYFTTKGAKNGTGLGLYMSKIIIEKHLNGILSAENIEGGVCFIVKLPYSIENYTKGE